MHYAIIAVRAERLWPPQSRSCCAGCHKQGAAEGVKAHFFLPKAHFFCLKHVVLPAWATGWGDVQRRMGAQAGPPALVFLRSHVVMQGWKICVFLPRAMHLGFYKHAGCLLLGASLTSLIWERCESGFVFWSPVWPAALPSSPSSSSPSPQGNRLFVPWESVFRVLFQSQIGNLAGRLSSQFHFPLLLLPSTKSNRPLQKRLPVTGKGSFVCELQHLFFKITFISCTEC